MTTAEPRSVAPWKIALWVVLAMVLVPLFGPRLVAMFRPPPGYFLDFSQEWLSARNYWTGSPAYSPQLDALKRHTGQTPNDPDDLLPWNAHPPAAVLLALPLGQVTDYPTAHFYWNLATFPMFLLAVFLVVRELASSLSWWALLPAVALIAVCNPLYMQLGLGQLNSPILLLIALAWVADRHDRQTLAGLALGLAVGLKLFPAFLLVYFLLTRRWRVVGVGIVTLLVVNAAAWAVFGPEAFRTYIREVMPSLRVHQTSWKNTSLTGYWLRIFAPHAEQNILALREMPQLGQALAWASQLVMTLVVAWLALRARTPLSRERAFAAAVLGMVLVSPIAWTHYFVLLVIPVGILWARLANPVARVLFWVLFILLLLPENLFALLALGQEQARLMINHKHAPIDAKTNLLALSAFTYVLLALFALVGFLKSEPPEPVPVPPRSDPDSDLPVDEQRVDRRLFGRIGDD